jgi:hypothetical protein
LLAVNVKYCGKLELGNTASGREYGTGMIIVSSSSLHSLLSPVSHVFVIELNLEDWIALIPTYCITQETEYSSYTAHKNLQKLPLTLQVTTEYDFSPEMSFWLIRCTKIVFNTFH